MNTQEKVELTLPVRHSLTAYFASSWVIAVLMMVASIGGLLYQTAIYPTDELVLSFVPNDVVNLIIGVPILLVSMDLTRRRKLVGLLMWPGALFYVFYTYIVYLLSTPLNIGFLLHLTLVTMSGYTVISLVGRIDGDVVRQRLTGVVPERGGGGVLAGLGLLFFLRVVFVLINTIINETPVTATELALHIADFLIAPAWVILGILLWRRKTLGYVTGLGLLFQASMLFIGLIFVMIIQPILTSSAFMLVDVLVITVMGMVTFVPFALFMRGIVTERKS
jgi:hypothetical protein